jgi:hypothetical protein
MKTLVLYSIAATMYVIGGALMKYSQGLTRALSTLGLTALFSTGALIQARAGIKFIHFRKGMQLVNRFQVIPGNFE